jgi:O-antigen biosynthesis protein
METNNSMTWTGERFTPGNVKGDIEVEHWHRYALAREFVSGKDVLDIACGEGYGSHYLSEKAGSVIGVDISAEAVNFAKSKYISKKLEYQVGSCTSIPLTDHSVDAVVSFETIEHHDKHEEMFLEIKRVLKPGGLLIISSPDKHNYSEVPNEKNEFHVKELYRPEFEDLIKRHFKNFSILGQKLVTGSLIASETDFQENQKKSKPSFDYIENNGKPVKENWINRSIYLLALASDASIPEMAWSVFESDWVQKKHAQEILEKSQTIARLEQEFTKSLAELDNVHQALNNVHKELENTRGNRSLIQALKSWRGLRFLRFIAHRLKNKKT